MNRIFRYSYPQRSYVNGGLESEISRLFDNVLADFSPAARSPRFPVDLYEDKENTYVRAELPGVSRDALNLEIAYGTLTIEATSGQDDQKVTFKRSIALPDTVQAEKVTAAYENGVLTVTLPKQEQAKARKIDITAN